MRTSSTLQQGLGSNKSCSRSIIDVDETSPFYFAAVYRDAERRLIECGTEWTILRCGLYSDLLLSNWLEPARSTGVIAVPAGTIPYRPPFAGRRGREILDRFNECLTANEQRRAEYEHVAIEIPPGKPQIEYFDKGDQWTPRGDVLRCVISDGGPGNEPIIHIDDRDLSWMESGRLLTTYAGWGMRIIFVPMTRRRSNRALRCASPGRTSDECLREVAHHRDGTLGPRGLRSAGPCLLPRSAQFRFIAVEGWMDCHAQRDGRPFVEFTWDGNDGGDPVSGRGWVALKPDGTLSGHIYFHHGDGLGFTAIRTEDETKPHLNASPKATRGRR